MYDPYFGSAPTGLDRLSLVVIMTPCYWLFLLWIQIISITVRFLVVPSYGALQIGVKRSPGFIICVHAFVCVCNKVVVCPHFVGYYRYCFSFIYCLCTVHWPLWDFGRHTTSAIVINGICDECGSHNASWSGIHVYHVCIRRQALSLYRCW